MTSSPVGKNLWFVTLQAIAFSVLAANALATTEKGTVLCSDSFKAIAQVSDSAEAGAIPGFTLTFQPKVSLLELQSNLEKLRPGHSEYVLGESGTNKWAVENRTLPGKSAPEIVSVKYEKAEKVGRARDTGYEGITKEETDLLRTMRKTFEATGIDRYFAVVEPLEIQETYAVYPYLEALDFREIARSATASMKPKKKFNDPWETGGPIPRDANPAVAHLWQRHQAGMEAAIVALRTSGWTAQRETRKSWTTGEPYLVAVYFGKWINGDYVSFSVRSNDMLVTTDGKFVIVDPY